MTPLKPLARCFTASLSLVTVLALSNAAHSQQQPAPAPAVTGPGGFDKTAIEAIVRDYILANPEIIIEAIQTYQAQQAALKHEQAQQALIAHKTTLETDPGSPVAGNPDGDVTVVEFFDYQCGYCKRVFPSLRQFVEKDGGVRFVFKELPILGEGSAAAARMALAAWHVDPSKYLTYHGLLMENRGPLTERRAMFLAAEAGYDAKAVSEKARNPKVTRQIDANHALADALDIRGTPAFVIGERLIPGAVTLEQLRGLVAEARGG